MELRQLELFVAVAEERHFTRAATRCSISQSALSTSIRTLERELDVPLFTRTTRAVDLTEAGRALLDEARRTLAAAAAARAAVRDVQGGLRGTLRVGGIATGSLIDQAALLAEFGRRHQNVELMYTRDLSDLLVPRVSRGTLDLAFVALAHTVPQDLQVIELATEPVVFVCRADHPLAARRSVPPAAIADELFVSAPEGSVAREMLAAVIGVAGNAPHVPYETNDLDMMLGMVREGLATTVLPRSFVNGRPDLSLVRVTDKRMTSTIALLAQTADRLSPPGAAFLDLVVASRALRTKGAS